MNRLRLAALLAATTLVAAGCSDDDPEPRIDPTPGTSPTGSASPSPSTARPSVQPSEPPEADNRDLAGAEAFIRYFWDLANYAQSTGDTSTLRRLGSESCGGCNGAFDFIDEVYSAQGTIKGGKYTLGRLVTTELTASGSDAVIFRSTFPTSNTRQVVSRPGEEPEVYEAATVRARFTLSYKPEGWQVDIWEVLP
jgi:hypothetical protein